MLKNDSWQSSQHETHLAAEESGENDKRHSSKSIQVTKYHVLIYLAMLDIMFIYNKKNMGHLTSREGPIEDISFSNELS